MVAKYILNLKQFMSLVEIFKDKKDSSEQPVIFMESSNGYIAGIYNSANEIIIIICDNDGKQIKRKWDKNVSSVKWHSTAAEMYEYASLYMHKISNKYAEEYIVVDNITDLLSDCDMEEILYRPFRETTFLSKAKDIVPVIDEDIHSENLGDGRYKILVRANVEDYN